MSFCLFIVSLVDLGDKNDTKLKSPFDIAAENVASGGRETVEAAQITTMQMAEQAGKTSIKCEFFDVSCLSFIRGLSIDRKEGYLLEKLNDYHCDHHAFFHTRYYCDLCKCHDGPKWFVIKDSYIVDIQLDTHEVCFPMLVDREFQVLTGIHNTDNDDSIKINNLQRTLVIKCSTAHDCDEWAQHLSNLTEQAKDFVSALRSRFNSYTPVRENQLAYWFINGKSYMEAVVKALLIAKEEVIRHPRYNTKDGLLLWSHHEKMVVIDEKIAFIGGIDLCHGRWDDEHMRLVDLGDKNDTKLKSRFDIVAENVASRDRETVETAQITTVRTAEQAGEISVKTGIKDDEDSDDEKILEEQQPIINTTPELDRKHRYFIGKDYANAYEKDFKELEDFRSDYIIRTLVPRMPWHDEALVVFGQTARDVARHFIQRWNIHKCEKYLNNNLYPFLLPKSYDDVEDLAVENWRDFLEGQPFRVNAQCVRSVGPWSVRTKSMESSIHNTYIQMIDAAKHFIYIENQFFIIIAQDSVVQNQIADVLFRRIERAHKYDVYFII
ncbi:unnamed protein product [Rotaria sp. Silwood1]|nr:unnamed protein product [Rotaria sp. Silwood1]